MELIPELFDTIINNIHDSVLITEAEPLTEPGPRILYVNKTFTDLTGYSVEEVIGRSPRFLQGPKTNRSELRRLQMALLQWQPAEVNLINYKKSGEEFWVNLKIFPMKREDGIYTHWIGIQREITEEKNEEIQRQMIIDISGLFATGQNLRQTLNHVLSYISEYMECSFSELWLVNRDKTKILNFIDYMRNEPGKIFESSSNIKEFEYGEGLPGSIWKSKKIELWDTQSHPNFVRKKQALEAGIQTAIGLPLFHNNEVVGVIAFGNQSSEIRMREFKSFLEDLTTFLGVEIRRKQTEEESNDLFLNSPDIVALAGSNGKFIKVNPTFSEILGWTKEELTTMPIWDFMHPEDVIKTQKEYSETIVSKGRTAKNFENRYKVKSGGYRWISWSSSHVTNSDGIAFAFGRDIHERKVYEESLMKLNKDLENSNTELEQFAYVTSHDLQEPLRMITSFLTQLSKKYESQLDEKARQYIFYAVDGAKRMRQIILDLLEFSRVSRSLENSKEEIDLNDIVLETIQLFHKTIVEKNAKIIYSKLPRIQSFKVPISQVFQNIIGNALKYSKNEENPIIQIEVEDRSSEWLFKISDNGIGIESEYFDKIFVIFQRLHTREEYEGTGMGLAITKKIIDNLGGKIWVRSNIGVGSTFYFTLEK